MIFKWRIVGILIIGFAVLGLGNIALALAPVTSTDPSVKVEEAKPVIIEGTEGPSADAPSVIIGKSVTESKSLVSFDSKVAADASSSSQAGDSQKVEEQVGYLQQQHLPEKIQQLTQSVQDLKGLVEIQGHQIEQLKKQVSDFYADLDNRLEQMKVSKGVKETKETKEAKGVKETKEANLTAGEPPVETPSSSDDDDAVIITTAQSKDADASSSGESDAYQKAFQYIKNKKYSEAIQSFKEYLKQYPQGQFTSESHFWLGELYALSGNNAQAKTELMIVVNKYPRSIKASDALLKLGSAAYEQQAYAEARMWWNKLVKIYPNAAAARIAEGKLKDLHAAGN